MQFFYLVACLNHYKISLSLLFLFAALNSLATTFAVTSNADSGPGSFRDALRQAAANGSAARDQIVFNLADLSRSGRTITLLSALPSLSSNLVIDGTTQPGTAFGISSARVIIGSDPSLQYLTFFEAYGQTDIEIYGPRGGPMPGHGTQVRPPATPQPAQLPLRPTPFPDLARETTTPS